jgi:sugar phosphate isomerase/epimerase
VVALENLNFQNHANFEYLMDNIPELGFCYDCGHHHLYTPNADLMKKYGARCIAVHIHDNFLDYAPGHDWTRDLHVLPFDGKMDMERVARELAHSSYNDVVMIEAYHISVGEPQLYKDMTLEQFLNLLKKRGEQFAALVKKYKK